MNDASFLSSGGLQELIDGTGKSKISDAADPREVAEFRPRIYEKIKTFEGPDHQDNSGTERRQTIVCVAIEPAVGGENEFDAWYRKQTASSIWIC